MQRDFFSETAANALGTLLALAVVYLVGVIAGAFTAHPLLVGASVMIVGLVLLIFGLGMVGGSGWARLGRGVDDD